MLPLILYGMLIFKNTEMLSVHILLKCGQTTAHMTRILTVHNNNKKDCSVYISNTSSCDLHVVASTLPCRLSVSLAAALFLSSVPAL